MVDINKRRKVIESKDPATLAPAAEPEKKGVDINARAAKLGINGRYSRVDQKAVNDELRKYAVSERPSTAEESILKGADSVVAGAIVPLVKIAEERERERQTNENISRSLEPMRGMSATKQSSGASVIQGHSGEAMLRDERKIGDISKELDKLSSERRHAADELGRTFDSLGVDDPTLIVAPMRAKISEMDSKIAELEAAKADALERTAARKAESKALKYEQLDSRADFAENSKYSSTAHGKPVYNAWRMQGGYYDDTGFDDLTYDYINGNPTARSVARVNDLAIGATEAGIDMGYLATMTPEEVARYNYLYKTEGKEASEKYLKYISSDPDYTTATLNARRRAEQEKWAADYAREHPVVASIGSILTSPTKGLSYIGQVADYLDDGKIDQNAGYNKYSYLPAAERGEVSRMAEEKWGKVGSFLYQTGMSMGDFLLNAGITGGNQSLSLAIMGSGAAADATIEAKDKGLSDDQAFALGTIAGAAEVLTEKVSLETLLDKTSLSKSALGYWLKNVLAEGSEEVGSDLINTLADLLIAQDKSELRTAIDAYVKQGHTESEAVGLALRDVAADMGVSFLGGALSGGVMAAGPAAVSGIRSNTDPRIEFASDAPASTGVVIAENETTTPAAVEMPRSAAASMTASRMDTKNPNAQRVYNSREVETFVQNSDAFGENGKKAFTTMYDGGDFAAFYADFAANYNAGVRGTSRGNVTNRYSGTLTDAQALAAYSAGKNDAEAGASTRQTSSGLKIYSRSEAGLVAESASLIADEGERSTVDKLAKSLGVRVQIENIALRSDGSRVNGYIKDGDIYISAGADSVTTVLTHELSHRIQEAAPKEYAKYRRLVMEQLAREYGSDVNLVEQRKTEYQRGGVELSNEEAMDEIAADYAQRIMDDPAKFAEVAGDNPNLARRLLNTLHNLILRVKSALGNEAARLERIEAEWRRALTAAQRTVAKAQQTVETANTSTTAAAPSVAASYSIEYDAEGTPYVVIDEDILAGVPRSEWVRTVKNNMREKFPNGVVVGNNEIAIDKQSRNEMTYSRYMQQLMKRDPAMFADKLRATNNADEIIRASRNYVNESLIHPRKDNIEQFARGEVQMRVGENDYAAQVVVAMRSNGKLLLYDIIDLTPTEISAQNKKSNAAKSVNPSPGVGRSTASGFSTPSISESGEDVNTRFSQDGQGIRYSIDPGFVSNIGAWEREGRPEGESFVLGSTGEVLQGLGAIESDIYMLGEKISKILRDHPEITLDEIKRIPEILDDPVLILKSKGENRGGQNTRMVIFGSVKAQNGQPMLAVLDLRPVENHLVLDDMQKVSSVYTRSNAWNYVSDSEIMYADAKRTIPLLRTIDLRSNGERSIELQRSGSMGSISYSGQNVNMSGVKFSDVVSVGKEEDTKFSLSADESLTDAAGQDIITDEERSAILQYKSSESFKINAKLRDGLELSEQEKRFVENLDSGLRKLPKVEGTLYRTLNFDDVSDTKEEFDAFMAEHEEGTWVLYDAYTSASTKSDGYPLADGAKFGVVIHIDGKNARDLNGFGNNFESEVIYPRGTKFDVRKISVEEDGYTHIYLEEAGENGETVHSEERSQAVQQVQEKTSAYREMPEVSEGDSGRGSSGNRLPGVRAEGVDEKFSLSQNKRAGEVEFLRELNDYLREQMKMTSRPRMTQNAMNEVVRDVTSRWDSAAKKADITEKLWRLYGEMASGKDSDGGALAWETVRDEATEIAGEILRGAVQQSNPMYEEYGELRRTLRDTKIAISETDKADLADAGGYTEFRKQNEHRLTLSKNGVPVDQIYDELHERYGELFPASITHPADQLIHIAEVLDSLQPVYENVYSEQEMAEANDYIAAELIDGFYSVPTEGMETERVRAEKNAQIEQIKKDGREAMRRAVQAERESKERAVENLKKQYEKREQRRADSATRQKLLKLMQRCERMKTTPQNKAKIAELIGELDTVSVGITGKTLAELEGIKDHVERMRELDPDYMPNPKTLEAIDRISKKRVADMSMEDVTDLIKALRNIETEARNERRMVDSAEKLDIYIAGEQLIEDVRAAKGTSKVKAASALIAETLSPERYVKRITGYREGNALVTAMKELSDGQRKSLDYRRRSEELLEQFTSDKKFMASITGKNAKTVKISAFKGGELTNVEITRDMLISLYLASKNEQNLYHMAEGGVRVPDMALYRKGKIGDAYDRGTVVKIAPGVAKSAVLKLTEQERAYAEVIHYYFNSVSKAAINEVSMKLRGYEAAEVEEYYPIQSDSAYTRSSPETVISKDASIANPGWLEKRETRASNPLRLIDATKVTSDAIAQHGMYYGIAIPANNMVKLLNVTVSEMDENTGERIKYSDSVRNALKNVWGAEAEDYLNGILSDVQKRGSGSDGALGAMLGKLRSGYAGAVLTLNASVALKQAASYTTAAAEIGWKPLAKAMKDFGSVDLDLIAKYTPLQWYRSLGYSSTELGDMAKNKKQMPKALNWIQLMDVATTRKLWKASEYYVRDGNKALKTGTEEYYREVADVYNRVIENTQPNYTAMQRSKVLRSDNQLVRSLMMFKTQPFQNFNILYDAAGEYAAKARQYKANPNAETKAAAKTARGRLAAAITSQLVSAAIFASMTAVWNMFRGKTGAYEDEEKDEMTVESFLAKLGKDTLSSLMGSVPFGSDAYNFAASKLFDETYYGMEVSSVSAISDLAESVGNLWSVVESAADASTGAENWSNVWVEFDRSADNITKVFGVPYENVVNLINASARWAMKGIFGKYLGNYYALRMTTNTKRSTEYYDCLWRAYKNDRSAYEKIYADMVKSGFSEDAIRSNMEKRMKDEQGVEKVDELDSRYLSPEQSRDYDALAREVAASRLWRSANSGQKESAEGMMYDLATNNGDGKKIAEKVDGGAAYGLSESDYILYKLALEMVDEPSESGKYGTYTNDEVQAAIDMVYGLSDAARAYLWEAAGKNAKTNPYR